MNWYSIERRVRTVSVIHYSHRERKHCIRSQCNWWRWGNCNNCWVYQLLPFQFDRVYANFGWHDSTCLFLSFSSNLTSCYCWLSPTTTNQNRNNKYNNVRESCQNIQIFVLYYGPRGRVKNTDVSFVVAKVSVIWYRFVCAKLLKQQKTHENNQIRYKKNRNQFHN